MPGVPSEEPVVSDWADWTAACTGCLALQWAELGEQAAGKVWPVKDIGLSRSESGGYTGDLGRSQYY